MLTFSNFFSGNIKAHNVPLETLSNTFLTIVIQPYLFSNGGFIKTLVIGFDLIHSHASFVLESNWTRFVFPSLWINILAQAKAYISLSNSIPNNCFDLIFFAVSVLIPPASLIILHIDLTKNAPDPHAASITTPFLIQQTF